MTGRTHDLAAITLLAATLTALPLGPTTLSTLIAAFFANQIGGIFPDIDQPTAPLWRNLPVGSIFGKVFGKLSGGHRFITHSLLGVGLAGCGVHWLLVFLHPLVPSVDIYIVWWAFMIGVASHLVMDSFTREGVPWLLPLPHSFGFPPIRRLRIVTGKKFESIVVFPTLIAINIWLCATHYRDIIGYLRHFVT
jgi:inner membrane protein